MYILILLFYLFLVECNAIDHCNFLSFIQAIHSPNNFNSKYNAYYDYTFEKSFFFTYSSPYFETYIVTYDTAFFNT